MSKISIIIADDHKLIRETWSFMLKRDERFEVLAECGDGKQTVEIAKIKQPSIILLDVNMPVMNGFQALPELNKYACASKVICISSHSEPAYVRKMIRLGARGYVTKNSPRQEMFEAIEEVHKGNIYICTDMKNHLSQMLLIKDPISLPSLTPKEKEVVKFLKDGLISDKIAKELNLSIKTIERHRHNILTKLKLKNTASLINYFNNYGDL